MNASVKKAMLLGSLAFCVVLAGCATPSPATKMTQLQIRQLQTRTYSASNTIGVMKAVIGALQDMGFTVTNASNKLGFIVAESDQDVGNTTEAVLAQLFAGPNARYRKDARLAATVNVTAYDGNTHVRTSFAQKVYDNQGGVMSTQQIVDPKLYRKFFKEIQQSVYLKQQGVA